METLGARIRSSRESLELRQGDLAQAIGVRHDVISNWERDVNKPNADQMVELCRALGIKLSYLLDYYGEDEPSLTLTGQRIGRAYEKATPPVQRTVEVALEPYIEPENLDNVIQLDFGQSEQPASAGTGFLLSEETMRISKVRADALPKDYEKAPDRYFGVPVAGDSMEPTYHAGDMLVVSREPVNVGEIGIFTLEGEGYVKKLGRGVLHSLNPDYDDIPLTENVICNGKVIGVLDPEAIGE